MRCPACGQELDDVGQCPNCAPAAADPGPPADPTIELTPVFSSGDPALIALAKSLLEGEGIDYLVRGEGVQDLFGGGRIGAGFNIVTGPAQFVVREDDAQRARELLGDLSAAESD
jgi:hypothetical protein